MKKFIFRTFMVMIFLLLILFVGIEVIYQEFDTRYVVFIKKHVSFQVFFEDGVSNCGECDPTQFEYLDKQRKSDFNELCRYRYDLQPAEYCYKYIYETLEKSELERYQLYKKNVLFNFTW